MTRKPAALALALSLVAGAPGLPAYQACAAVFRASGFSSPTGSSASAWAGAVASLAGIQSLRPGAGAASPMLTSLLGHLRLELSVNPRSSAALAFVKHLPAALASDPAAFAALPVETQVHFLELAAAEASAALTAEAESLLSKDSPAPGESARLAELGAAWFFLPSETASKVRLRAGIKSVGLARRIGRKLGLVRKDEVKAVDSELSAVFAGAMTLAAQDGPSSSLVHAKLSPYVSRALDEAETRVQARGIEKGMVTAAVIAKHDDVFGRLRPKELFKTLRGAGLWTEFVAAMSLSAAEKLGALKTEKARNTMANAAEGDGLRIAIPAWHPLFGKFQSISEWIFSAHGKTDDGPHLKGKALYTAFGIPVRVQAGLMTATLAYAWMFKDYVAKAGYDGGTLLNFGAAWASALLLYAAVLAHEYGHAWAASWFGIRTRQLILNPLGGGADVLRGFRRAWPEFVIAVAGPITSVLAGALFLGLALLVSNPFLHAVLVVSGGINFMLAGMNMIPVLPMDGGRVLRAGLTRLIGSYAATKAAAWFTIAGGIALTAVSLWLPHIPVWNKVSGVLFGLFLIFCAKIMMVHPGTVTVDERAPKDGKR